MPGKYPCHPASYRTDRARSVPRPEAVDHQRGVGARGRNPLDPVGPCLDAIMPTGRLNTGQLKTGRARRWVCLFTCVLALPSCGRSEVERATAEEPAENLPSYDPEAARVFDDSIAPEVFGLQVERVKPSKDRLLSERVRAADHVARVKLRTILEERFADSLRYRIVVQPLGPAIVGGALPPELELTVGRASPSLSMLRSMSVEAVGAKFILLLKRYQLNDEPVLHFRGEPDQDEVLDAIRQASIPEP